MNGNCSCIELEGQDFCTINNSLFKPNLHSSSESFFAIHTLEKSSALIIKNITVLSNMSRRRNTERLARGREQEMDNVLGLNDVALACLFAVFLSFNRTSFRTDIHESQQPPKKTANLK